MKPIRILHVLNGLYNGGTESVIMNWYRNIDTSKVQFDFLIRTNCNVFADEIEKLGGRVFITPEYPKHYFKNKKETKKFFEEHMGEYAAIHVHGNSLLYVNVFNIAKKCGISNRIYHSHSISTGNFVYRWLHKLNRLRIKKLATHYLACSEIAGRWGFGKVPFTVINNGVALSKFKFDKAKRQQVRESLGLEDSFVCGHVGRFVPVKNHTFLIDVFKNLLQKKADAKLLLIGNGDLKDEIKDRVNKMGLEDKILFLDGTNGIGALMQAMDVFLLPSKFEGLGIVAVEAQASGLKVFVSDAVPKEVGLTENIRFLPIDDESIWVDEILDAHNHERKDESDSIVRSGYEIKEIAKTIENLYLNL